VFLSARDVHHYRWDFGDGTTGETDEPTVHHSYEARDRSRRSSDFLVRAEAVLDGGGYVKGHGAIEIPNLGRQTLDDKGKVLIEASFHPRFAEAHPDGSVTQRVHLAHVMNEDVTLTRVTEKRVYSDERGELESPRVVDARSVVGASSVAPGRGIDVDLEIPSSEGAVSMVTYTLSGEAADGTPASGTFSIMRPSPPPTRETADEVTDPALVAKILAARRALGKPYVTAEEMGRLEREGRI
jgi:hypothetical protein